MNSLLRCTLGLLLATMLAPAVRAQDEAPRKERTEPLPPALQSVDVKEHPNARLPLHLEFNNERGEPVKLGDYFNQGKPVILTLNFFSCKMLCTLVLNGMVDALRNNGLEPGTDYEIVTVSFHPVETHLLASVKKDNYVDYWGDDNAYAGWHFLTGKGEHSQALADVVGYSYNWIPENQDYAHPAVLMLATPDGRMSRYLYGVQFDPQTLRLSLVEASQGKIGTPMDKILLYCYHYDASSGTYAPLAMRIMRIGGGLTLIIFGIVLGLFWSREKRRQGPGGAGTGQPPAVLGESNV
jgi:protein SCO1